MTETAARAIYDLVRKYSRDEQACAWVEGGNSDVQEECRRVASELLAAAPKVTVLDEWRVFGPNGEQWSSDQTKQAAQRWADSLNKATGSDDYTVRRVALLDDPTTRGEG